MIFYLCAEIREHKIPLYVVEKKHEKVREMRPNDSKEITQGGNVGLVLVLSNF